MIEITKAFVEIGLLLIALCLSVYIIISDRKEVDKAARRCFSRLLAQHARHLAETEGLLRDIAAQHKAHRRKNRTLRGLREGLKVEQLCNKILLRRIDFAEARVAELEAQLQQQTNKPNEPCSNESV